jgi:hypothetical protein
VFDEMADVVVEVETPILAVAEAVEVYPLQLPVATLILAVLTKLLPVQ